MKSISSHQSPQSPQPSPPPGRAHIDDIVKPEGEGTLHKPPPAEGWTVIAEEDIIQPHPHLAAEIVLPISVMADNSLCHLLTNFLPNCFCSLSHQSIFKAMLSLQSRGIAISPSTIGSQITEGGIGEDLSALVFLLPLFAVDQPTFYRYMGTVKFQWLTRKLQWCLQTGGTSDRRFHLALHLERYRDR